MPTIYKAAAFSGFLLVVLIASLIVVILSSGPVVLGTELNTNGLTEYLCLGRGCEKLP